MDSDERRRYATHGRDSSGYVGDDRQRWARAQWGTGENSAPAHRATGRSGEEYGRPPQRRPRGSGDLPKLVHFVSAADDSASAPSGNNHGDSRNPASSSSVDRAPQAMSSPPAPGSLASNTVVAKMMKRMNHKEGAGLGRHGQGIVAPIDVIPRPKNAGLGTAEGSIAGAFDPPPSSENWPKWDETTRTKKGTKRHRELDEKILAARPLEESAAEAVARVHKALARASRWSNGQGQPCNGEETTAAAVISTAMDRVKAGIASGTLTTGEVIREFTALKDKCPQEYTAYRLANAARAIVAALLRAAFRQWDPLVDPSRGLEVVAKLKDTLLDDGSAASPYAALVDDVVVGPVLASTWDANDAQPMIRFLEMWGDALPLPAIQRVLERAVMPKLTSAVASWEPGWDAAPCHAWVHPWIPLLGPRMLEPVYAAVRGKLAEELDGSHAARASAFHGVVAPWKDAFGTAAWGQLADGHVVPYVRRGIRAVRVTPPRQEDGGFGWVMRWAPVVLSARGGMAGLLEEEGFFGKWRDALRRWLWGPARPSLAEAVTWHDGWKRLLTPELLADERVRVPIEDGLQTIRREARGGEIYRAAGRGRQHADEAHPYRYVPPRRGRNRRQNRSVWTRLEEM